MTRAGQPLSSMWRSNQRWSGELGSGIPTTNNTIALHSNIGVDGNRPAQQYRSRWLCAQVS